MIIELLEAAAPRAREDRLASALDQCTGATDDAAIADLTAIGRDWPDWDEPRLRLAERLRRRGDDAGATEAYRAALACNPAQAQALLALGAIALRAGEADRAEPLLRRCCALTPGDAHARHAWGLALLMLSRPEAALEELIAAHTLDPGNAMCAVHLADAAHALGRAEWAVAMFEARARQDPADVGVLVGWATALAAAGDRAAAIDVLEAATLIAPDNQVSAAMFADMLARTTRQAQAELALRRALALDPANDDATMALSVVLMRLHRHGEAVALLNDLMVRVPDCVGALCNMATALVALGRQEEAVACAQRAIAQAPDHPAPRRALCNALPYLAGVTGAALLASARDCAERQPRARLPACANTTVRDRRLRIGLLSGTLRTHPVGWFTVAGLECLPASAFALVCLSPNPPEDAIGHRFAAIAESWEDIGSLDDRALAERARALALDIVIDLGGYGDFGRMPALAHRLAPVQIKWVGMQNHSTGLPEIEWFMTDRWETPPSLAAHYSERLLMMPDGYVCYAPPADAPDLAPLPTLAQGSVTFGCFNNLAKITPRVISVWSDILTALPSARLILKTHQFNDPDVCAALLAQFASHDIASPRIDLRGSSPHRVLLAQYNDVDMVLDPFPYSGGLTTCEALWMGVPTITMPGETFASRHSASHLSNVGLADWVVSSEAEYVAQAIARVGNLPALGALRAQLRDRVRASPLCDAPRFGVALGAALRSAWHDWCDSQNDLPV